MIAAAALSACSSRPVIDAPATVLLVGDSILGESSPDVSSVLEHGGWSVQIDPRGGSAITGGPTVPGGSWPVLIDRLVRASRPNVVVVELGTNDCGCAELSKGIDEVMKPIRNVRRVYWI